MKYGPRTALGAMFIGCVLLFCARAGATTGGSISGTVKDQSDSVVPGASLTLVNLDITTSYKARTDAQGFYSFPTLPVGRYELTIEASGFKPQKKTGLVVDADAAVRVDVSLAMGERSDTVTVSAVSDQTQAQVETVATHLGEVVQEAQITALPLNGRSYTDLLAIQPGVSPVTTLTPTSVIMSGVTGTINPSGDLNPGDVSINGQRESANGFMVNGTDVQEHMNGGTSVIPNLDSIQEFRLLTTNFDPEYGNYNGGMINVVTKSGSDSFHGNVFEFLRNTSLDAKNYFCRYARRFPPESIRRHGRRPDQETEAFLFRRLSRNADGGERDVAANFCPVAGGSRRGPFRRGKLVDGKSKRTSSG